jgi:hypothetical protein
MIASGELKSNKHSLDPEYLTKKRAEAKEFLGVYWDKKFHHFRSTVTIDAVPHNCGVYDTARAAAKARDLRILHLGSSMGLQVLKRKEL